MVGLILQDKTDNLVITTELQIQKVTELTNQLRFGTFQFWRKRDPSCPMREILHPKIDWIKSKCI